MMDTIMGGKERELKSCSWKNERRKERKEGGREEERRKERKDTGKGAGRGTAELPEPERLTQDSRAQDTWPCLPHPLCCLHMAPLPWTGGSSPGGTCTTAGLREPLPHSALQNFTPSR